VKKAKRDLRVIVWLRDGFWFARGLEIDYAAQGKSLDEVKANFERGLALTIEEHLKVFGNLNHMLLPPPSSTRLPVESLRHEQVDIRVLPAKLQKILQFELIKFLKSEPQSAVA
jgi:predicted RNase H-like HicB family nuclease